ncbi:hypothetical protein FPV67DRAFT_1625304 [Lyophyllum atratum]|nr:hypothetical protein FPV67DRAFT_1625304 [Lyophyllum atratum]
MSYGYDAYTRNRPQLSDMTIHDHAETLMAALAAEREETDTQRRPIIFVAHSLGGIVLKNAMVQAHLSTRSNKFHHKSVELSTYGINFLGTPHLGTDTDLADLLLSIQSIYSDTNDAVLRDLALHSPALQQQLSQYASISGNYKTNFFFETFDTELFGGVRKRLVPKFSAVVPGATDVDSIPLHKDHVDMAKYESDKDGDFQSIVSHLMNMVKAAPAKIEKQWESDDRHEEMSQKEKAGIQIMSLAERATLNTLPYADGASYNVEKGCLLGTRAVIVDSILTWIKSANHTKAAEIYFLTGGAGVGKTSIAHTVGQRCEGESLLMSSFFFDAQMSQIRPAYLFSTIARNLAERSTTFRRQIVHALEKTKSLAGAAVFDHFTELILKPSRSLRDDEPVVIVVDALDEGDLRETLQVLRVLRDEVPKLPGTLRILITARMTPDIEFYLQDKPHVRTVSINTDDESNRDDIVIYSHHVLRDIAIQKRLGGDWPSPLLLKDFISRSGGLFIWVSTVYDLLRSSVNADKQLKSIISSDTSPHLSPEQIMDELYLAILQRCNWKDTDFAHGYHLIIGSVMAARTPLSISALQSLHRHTLTFPIRNLLLPVASLLTGIANEDSPIQILHQSLKDFITIRARSLPSSQDIYINETQHSQRLALLCLVVLNEDLPQIASTVGGYLAATESEGIPEIAGHPFSAHLLYACEFWMDHLVTVEQPTRELVEALRVFLSTNVITWMEVVTLTRQFEGLSRLREWIEKELSSDRDIANSMVTGEIAQSLLHLSDRLRYMDRRGEALEAIEEAVRLYRLLAHAQPTAFNAGLARCLNRVAYRLSDLGHQEEALKADKEAVGIYRLLAKTKPNVFEGDLASCLSSLASKLIALGHRQEAVKASEEAIGIYRQLATTRPTEFNSHLADSLQVLGEGLLALGRREEALMALEEAVALYRTLSQTRPGAFSDGLAWGLHSLADMLTRLGRREESLKAVEEAVGMFRPPVERPDSRWYLPSALHELAYSLFKVQRQQEALASAEEAIRLYRELLTAHPNVFDSELAWCLETLALVLSALGCREEALNASNEAVSLHRPLAEAHPSAFNHALARSLNNEAYMFSDLGHRYDALRAAEESNSLFQPLAKAHPKAFNEDFAWSLTSLANRLAECGRRDEALKASEQAILVYRTGITALRDDEVGQDFSESLVVFAQRLSALGYREDALATIHEAIAMYRRLSTARPKAYSQGLAWDLQNLEDLHTRLGFRRALLETRLEGQGQGEGGGLMMLKSDL